MLRRVLPLTAVFCILAGAFSQALPARAEGDWEITPDSDAALRRGLAWLARTQGPEGNWESNDLGLVGMGALAFLAAGHTPGVGQYGKNVDRALNYVLKSAKPSGLLNIADGQRDMYNHGLATFVLGQAHGMTSDPRISPVLDRALKLIANTQCNDGGWDYRAKPQANGHDLSLAVMQAKALRSAVDSGLEVPPEVIDLAIKSVREHYKPANNQRNASEAEQQKLAGQFTYDKGGGQATIAMAAAGVVCLQEFGQYDDWRIGKNMEVITAAIREQKPAPVAGKSRSTATRSTTSARRSTRWAGRAGSRTIPSCGTIWSPPKSSSRPIICATACGSRADTSADTRASCTAPRWPVLSCRCPTDTCRSCKKARSTVCATSFPARSDRQVRSGRPPRSRRCLQRTPPRPLALN